MSFQPVEQHPDFPAQEKRTLERWRDRKIFSRSLEARRDAELFRFYEGPPTANGRPGTHHVPSRTFKDLFPRYRTMKGYRVPRQAGWDCHGIPVEVQVERELGFTRKQDIEDYGVAAFNARCRESVTRYVDEWNALTERIGFWVDLGDAYWTMAPAYVESVWWSLKQLWDADLMYAADKVVPYCPRCGTALSDHEVAQGYAPAEDPSVYVRFPLTEGRLAAEGAALLVWTTTPWTLISNTAVAIGPAIRYVLVEARNGGRLVLAEELVTAALGDDATILRRVGLEELRGLHYRGPFDYVRPAQDRDWRYVTVADFVTTDEGTGVVHLAPAFGEDDMAVAREHDLPILNPVDLEGRFDDRVTDFAGQFVKTADPAIVERLRAERLLVRSGTYSHTYPFCWRCSTPLLYYAKPSWYIRTTRIRDRLLDENAKVDWYPDHIRDGRYGNWLENNVDWALSRERYWGTPLPLWRCDECHEITAVGSRAELAERAGRDLSDLDPHRPYVDEVTFPCPECAEGTAWRVPEVIDAWYDSGSMPFAQFGYPHVPGSQERFEAHFPADFIAEGIDQTRGWFYSLMAVSTLLFDRSSYRTVLCLGLVVDDDGRKMSKSLGNVLDPWELIDRFGADALRWQLLTGGSPWVNQRLGPQALEETVRRFLLTLWNTYYFFVTYARIDGWTPGTPPPLARRPVMDRWILAELADTVTAVDDGLAGFDATAAGRRLADFVDDLSNWYVRRSRRRFWAPGDIGEDKDAAFSTLHECLVTVTALLAPFTPFVSDELFENLVRTVDGHAPDSVHLLDFPFPDPDAVDNRLRAAMAVARRVTELGRRARNEAGVGVRQPLRAALVTLPEEDRDHWDEVAGVVAEELNVKVLELPTAGSDTIQRRLKPNFGALGPDFGPRTPKVAAAIEAADPERVATTLRQQGAIHLEVDHEPVRLEPRHVQVLEEARTGWQVASDGPYSVALDLTLDDSLRREGLAREAVRAINELRKQHGLEMDDRIALELGAKGSLRQALEEHRRWLADEVLATDVRFAALDDGEQVDVGADLPLWVRMTVVAD